MDSFIFQITKCQGSTGRLVATKRLAGTKNDGNITYQLNPLHSKPKKKSNFNFRLNIRETETIRWNVKKKKELGRKKFSGYLQLCYKRSDYLQQKKTMAVVNLREKK